MGMISLTKQDRKAFYSVVERYESSSLSNKLGSCFQMCYEDNANGKSQTLWVTSESNFRGKENQSKKFYAERCIPSKKNKNESIRILDVSKLNTNSGVSFIFCDEEDPNQKNCLRFGKHDSRPSEALVCVLDNQNKFELRFIKSGDDYILDWSSSDKPSKDFELRKAIGAPIIKKNAPPARNQVVGILHERNDGTPYPVFFGEFENTFRIDISDQTTQQEQPDTSSRSGEDMADSPTTAASGNTDTNEKDTSVNDVTDTFEQIDLDGKDIQEEDGKEKASGNSAEKRSGFVVSAQGRDYNITMNDRAQAAIGPGATFIYNQSKD